MLRQPAPSHAIARSNLIDTVAPRPVHRLATPSGFRGVPLEPGLRFCSADAWSTISGSSCSVRSFRAWRRASSPSTARVIVLRCGRPRTIHSRAACLLARHYRGLTYLPTQSTTATSRPRIDRHRPPSCTHRIGAPPPVLRCPRADEPVCAALRCYPSRRGRFVTCQGTVCASLFPR